MAVTVTGKEAIVKQIIDTNGVVDGEFERHCGQRELGDMRRQRDEARRETQHHRERIIDLMTVMDRCIAMLAITRTTGSKASVEKAALDVENDLQASLDESRDVVLTSPTRAELVAQRDEARAWSAAWKRKAKLQRWHIKARWHWCEEAASERDALRRLLAAALDENPTWSSDAAFEAERVGGEGDGD